MILIGAGGHAKCLVDILRPRGQIKGYVDNKLPTYFGFFGKKYTDDTLPKWSNLAMGFVGLTPKALARRIKIMDDYWDQGHHFPNIIHDKAIISWCTHGLSSSYPAGVQVLAGAVVNFGATLSRGCVINTNAIIEHEAIIGAGTHIAPGAIVLGGAVIGDNCFIGAGAIIIQGKFVPDNTFIKAGTIWRS